MAKVKNISIADMVDGQWYVVDWNGSEEILHGPYPTNARATMELYQILLSRKFCSTGTCED